MSEKKLCKKLYREERKHKTISTQYFSIILKYKIDVILQKIVGDENN